MVETPNLPPPEEIAHHYAGVLLVTDQGQFIGQQRDDKPEIDNPGKVGTFGGTVEAGEDPRRAAWRELIEEETNLTLLEEDLILFHEDVAWRDLTKGWEARHIYYAIIDAAALQSLEVYEGQGWAPIQGANDPRLIDRWRIIIEQFENIAK